MLPVRQNSDNISKTTNGNDLKHKQITLLYINM